MNATSINRRALATLIKLALVIVSGFGFLVMIAWALISIFSSPEKGDEIYISGRVVNRATQEPGKVVPVRNVEVRYMRNGVPAITQSDSDGQFRLAVQTDGTPAGQVSIYHPNYRPIVKPIDFKASGDKEVSLQEIILRPLVAESEIDPNLFHEIHRLHRRFDEARISIGQALSRIEQQGSPDTQTQLKQSDLKNDLEDLDIYLNDLLTDSLLYSLREVDKTFILKSIGKARNVLEEVQ